MLLVSYLLQIVGVSSAQHGQDVLPLNCCQIHWTASFDVSWFLQPPFTRKKTHHWGFVLFCYNRSSYYFGKVVALLFPLYGSLIVSLFIIIAFLFQYCCESTVSREKVAQSSDFCPVLTNAVAGDSSSEAPIRNPHSSHSFGALGRLSASTHTVKACLIMPTVWSPLRSEWQKNWVKFCLLIVESCLF